MNVLICGASGFVGRHLDNALTASGHTVIRGLRTPIRSEEVAVDYCQNLSKADWLPKLEGIDAVINAVGVLRDCTDQPMKDLHERAPIALFSACREAGVKRIIQVSALGVDRGIETTYFQSRRLVDTLLQSMSDGIKWLVLRPSLIYGCDGASAKLFRLLARMPLHFQIGDGSQRLQPVHVDDLTEVVLRWLDDDSAENQTVSAVGLEETDLSGMLQSYRQQMGLNRARQLSIPLPIISALARIGDFIKFSPLCSDTLIMLMAGNTANPAEFTRLLGRSPQSYRTFITS